jgi:hypothetical protein
MGTNTSSGTTPAGGPDAEPTGPAGDSEDSQKWFAQHRQFSAQDPTGAFDNVLASLRFSPRPYRWTEVGLGLLILYVGFIGIPAAFGFWALCEVVRRVHHGG